MIKSSKKYKFLLTFGMIKVKKTCLTSFEISQKEWLYTEFTLILGMWISTLIWILRNFTTMYSAWISNQVAQISYYFVDCNIVNIVESKYE